MSDSDLTITLPVSQWQAIIANEPTAKETYTDEGISIFNAFQAIHQAVDQHERADPISKPQTGDTP